MCEVCNDGMAEPMVQKHLRRVRDAPRTHGRTRRVIIAAHHGAGAGAAAEFAPHRLVDFLTLVRQDGFVALETTMWSGEIRRPHLRDFCCRAAPAPTGGRSSLVHMAIVPTGGSGVQWETKLERVCSAPWISGRRFNRIRKEREQLAEPAEFFPRPAE